MIFFFYLATDFVVELFRLRSNLTFWREKKTTQLVSGHFSSSSYFPPHTHSHFNVFSSLQRLDFILFFLFFLDLDFITRSGFSGGHLALSTTVSVQSAPRGYFDMLIEGLYCPCRLIPFFLVTGHINRNRNRKPPRPKKYIARRSGGPVWFKFELDDYTPCLFSGLTAVTKLPSFIMGSSSFRAASQQKTTKKKKSF